MRKAEVILYDWPVSLLEEMNDCYRFSYRAKHLDDPETTQ